MFWIFLIDMFALQTVLVLKYVVPNYPFPTLYFGVANVIANGLIMLRYVDLFTLAKA